MSVVLCPNCSDKALVRGLAYKDGSFVIVCFCTLCETEFHFSILAMVFIDPAEIEAELLEKMSVEKFNAVVARELDED